MAYQSKFTGATVDELLTVVQNWKANPDSLLEGVQGDTILGKFSDSDYSTIKSKVWAKITGQEILDKINSVTGNIVFTKFVDAQAGAGDTTE